MGARFFVRNNYAARIFAAGPQLPWWRHHRRNDPSLDDCRASTAVLLALGAIFCYAAHPGNLSSCPVSRTLTESASSEARQFTRRKTLEPTADYDFVIIGNGNVGRSALREIERLCPNAKVAILDPLRGVTPSSQGVRYYGERAVGLDPLRRNVHLEQSNPIRYRHAVLIATGSHGAPPPSYLCEGKSRGKIMELRPSAYQTKEGNEKMLSTEVVREYMLDIVRKGGKVSIAGSGWDAIDLAVSASALASRSNQPILVFGGQGPLSHFLPPYLTSDLSKRLKSKKIQVLDRTLIRYVSHDDLHGERIHLHTAKSFDFLDTQSNSVDLLIVAPEVSGPRGSAVVPTDEIPGHLEEAGVDRSWYLPWSTLSKASVGDPSMIHCYKDDGRIAVNSELYVCNGVYAAGSVAKVPNGLTGHADVAGIGPRDGEEAGRVAAVNMLHQSPFFKSFDRSCIIVPLTKDPIPIWRSDLRSYGDHGATSLNDVGVHALCVGNCDQQSLFTHGVWWTKQSALRRLVRDLEGDDEENKNFVKEARQRIKKGLKPIFGLGVVYFTDRTGRVQGIMTWGIPYCEQDSNELNEMLVNHMKNILMTNGGFPSLESDMDYSRMSEYLENESKDMIRIAFERNASSEAAKAHMFGGSLKDFPRPLHRFSEPRPPGYRSVGIVKRKGGDGKGLLGEDLFSRYEEAAKDSPIPIPDYVKNVGSAARKVESLYNWNVWEQRERRWDDNENSARPPKEDALWVRKGDEMRSVSMKDQMSAAYSGILSSRNHP